MAARSQAEASESLSIASYNFLEINDMTGPCSGKEIWIPAEKWTRYHFELKEGINSPEKAMDGLGS